MINHAILKANSVLHGQSCARPETSTLAIPAHTHLLSGIEFINQYPGFTPIAWLDYLLLNNLARIVFV